MNQDKYVFAQLTAFLNRIQFNNFVRKYDANQNRDYGIFEDFAFYIMKEACEKRNSL